MNDLLDFGGYTTALLAVFLNVWNHMPKLEDVNDVIVTLTGVAGLVFLIYKLMGQRLSNESQRLDNESKRKELEEND